MLKGLLELMLLVVILGGLLGFALSRTEVLNPSVTAEQVRRMSAERAALEARNAYEQQRQQIDLERRQALTQKELEWRERWAEIAEVTVSFLVLALTFAIAVTGLGGAVYLICLGIVRLQEAAAPRRQPPSPSAKVIPLPVRSATTGSRPTEARPTPKFS